MLEQERLTSSIRIATRPSRGKPARSSSRICSASRHHHAIETTQARLKKSRAAIVREVDPVRRRA